MKKTASFPALCVIASLLSACGGGAMPATGTLSAQTDSVASATTSLASAHKRTTGVNLTALPLDDERYTTTGPKKTWVYSCQGFQGAPPSQSLPWVNEAAGTWNLEKKIAVRGAVSWSSRLTSSSSGTVRTVSGNGLPDHRTGRFPIAASDPAYRYDRNPNGISQQSIAFSLPANPTIAAKPSCLGLGAIGIMNTGAELFDAFDAAGRDAAVYEVLDACWGHPQMQGAYHYHTYSSCMGDSSTGHSKLLGYALDGFGIYGPRGEHGRLLTSKDLDECHGHTHLIMWNGKLVRLYHYHFTYDFPYSLGCYRGTPVRQGPPPPND